MAALPDLPFAALREYLETSYPDGDREYLDGIIQERNLGKFGHSALQKILIAHLTSFEEPLGIEILPECRTRIRESSYRVPDVLVAVAPFHVVDGVLLDAPFLIAEILSPDDRMRDVLDRFREYEGFHVPHIVQLDPEARTTFVFEGGSLIRRDLTGFEVPGRGLLPFDSRELLSRLDRSFSRLR